MTFIWKQYFSQEKTKTLTLLCSCHIQTYGRQCDDWGLGGIRGLNGNGKNTIKIKNKTKQNAKKIVKMGLAVPQIVTPFALNSDLRGYISLGSQMRIKEKN